MTINCMESEILQAVQRLPDMAKKLTGNNIADNYRFILSEINKNELKSYKRLRLRKKENDKKKPVTLQEIMPVLYAMYDNLYDINLMVYKSKKRLTIIEISYFPKSSLDEEFRKGVVDNPPMLHCKVAYPPWLDDDKAKFDINWEHKILRYKLKMLFLKLKRRLLNK